MAEYLGDPESNPLVIADETGETIFQIRPDGTAELPDPDRASLAAAIFWREVLHMAALLRVPVALLPCPQPEIHHSDRKPAF